MKGTDFPSTNLLQLHVQINHSAKFKQNNFSCLKHTTHSDTSPSFGSNRDIVIIKLREINLNSIFIYNLVVRQGQTTLEKKKKKKTLIKRETFHVNQLPQVSIKNHNDKWLEF